MFTQISKNIYSVNTKQSLGSICWCRPADKCGNRCLNRLDYTECVPETCPCGNECRNTKIQRHIVAPGVERFITAKKGWGLRTKQLIKKGTYVLEYIGEVVTIQEYKERMATAYVSDAHYYCLQLDHSLVIDSHRMGNDCRFVNHSCNPNCEMQKWMVNGQYCMALFASQDIREGEELTFDYNFRLFGPAEPQICFCESDNCRGTIVSKTHHTSLIKSKVRPK